MRFGRNGVSTATVEISMETFQRIKKIELLYDPTIPVLSGQISKENEVGIKGYPSAHVCYSMVYDRSS